MTNLTTTPEVDDFISKFKESPEFSMTMTVGHLTELMSITNGEVLSKGLLWRVVSIPVSYADYSEEAEWIVWLEPK